MLQAGRNLHLLRKKLGLTMREVERATEKIAERHSSQEFWIPCSRLSDIETKGIVPSIYRLYSLSVVYHKDIRELFAWFKVNLNDIASDLEFSAPPHSHVFGTSLNATAISLPLALDPVIDDSITVKFGCMIDRWGAVPASYLEQLATAKYSYGYIGAEDFTMYPILPPGSFIQIDETKSHISQSEWNSEYERPIYLIETREKYICSWCRTTEDYIVLESHPLSPVPARFFKYPHQAEVIGQVVGAALRIGKQ